jgi:phosphatidylethanolamine-binding protein (PEBP) family uncharacterized protein
MRLATPIRVVSSERARLNGDITKGKILLQLNSQSFQNGSPIPAEFAFGRVDPIHRFALSQNRNPQLEWKDVPEPTKSFVLICHDVDVPTYTLTPRLERY